MPRLRGVADPRLLPGVPGSGAAVPWEMRALAGERWDFHREERVRELWERGRTRWRAGEDEDGEEEGGGLMGMGMGKEKKGRRELEAMVGELVGDG